MKLVSRKVPKTLEEETVSLLPEDPEDMVRQPVFPCVTLLYPSISALSAPHTPLHDRLVIIMGMSSAAAMAPASCAVEFGRGFKLHAVDVLYLVFVLPCLVSSRLASPLIPVMISPPVTAVP